VDDPFLQLANGVNVSLKKATANTLKKYALPGDVMKTTPGRTLIAHLPGGRPLEWDWMRHTAAPLWHLQSIEKFNNIRVPQSIEELSYLDGLGEVKPEGRIECFQEFEIRQPRISQEAIAVFRRDMLAAHGGPMGWVVVVLRSSKAAFQVSNCAELAGRVCTNCTVEEVVADECNPREIIGKVSAALFVIAPHSKALSQILWADGTVVELIPKGTECTAREGRGDSAFAVRCRE
jgi:hypothetical protein